MKDITKLYKKPVGLYESIMKDVAKAVKRHLNENINNYDFYAVLYLNSVDEYDNELFDEGASRYFKTYKNALDYCQHEFPDSYEDRVGNSTGTVDYVEVIIEGMNFDD